MAFMDADAAGSVTQPGDEASQKQTLDIQGEIEMPSRKERLQLLEGLPSASAGKGGNGLIEVLAIPNEQFVYVFVVAQHLTGWRAGQPGNMA